MSTIKKIAPITNQVEAQFLTAELTERNIPHAIISHYDSAYDGVFQVSRGWGHVEAPEEFASAIINVLASLRDATFDEDTSSPE